MDFCFLEFPLPITVPTMHHWLFLGLPKFLSPDSKDITVPLASFLSFHLFMNKAWLIGFSHSFSKLSPHHVGNSALWGWPPCWLKSKSIALFLLFSIFFLWEAAKICSFPALGFLLNPNKSVIKLKKKVYSSLLSVLENASTFNVTVFSMKW